MAKKIKDMSEEIVETNTTEEVVADTAKNTEETTTGETPVEESPKEEQKAEKKETKKADSKSDKSKANKKGNHRSQKYQEKAEGIERNKRYNALEAVTLAQGASYSKFEGTIEAHINTTAKSIRGLVTLPFSAGKALRIVAFGKDAADSGADIIGTDETIAEIQKGKLNFDVVVTDPTWMPKLAKVAAILGPRGLMPSPKAGTITDNLTKAVAELQGGKTEYKTEAKGSVIHIGIGKVSQAPEEIAQNLKVLVSVVGKSRISKVTLAPTMGPGIKVELSSL